MSAVAPQAVHGTDPRCRSCGAGLAHTFADLGVTPLSNSYAATEELARSSPRYPLHARVCSVCFLVQLEEFETPEQIFSEYAYFSSYSTSWLKHVERYCEQSMSRFGLSRDSQVVEIASNDGYLLQYFQQAGTKVLGIEPARNVARAAEEKGIPTQVEFFGARVAQRLAGEGKSADLLIANNVLAHVPGLNDFVAGLKTLLKPDGVITLEVPHLMRLIESVQFDTIYHEHFSYFSLLTLKGVFGRQGLKLFDVEELPTHGGSLRLYAAHAQDGVKQISPAVQELERREIDAGLHALETYAAFPGKVEEAKRSLLEFFGTARRAGKKVCGYAAPAKATTLLNYCGIGRDLLDFTVDVSPHKQGRFIPGPAIPILAPAMLQQARPDHVLLFAWNLAAEIVPQLAFLREWGGKVVLPLPRAKVLE